VQAIVEGKFDEAGLTASERALLEYVEVVTKAASKTTAEDVQKLRDTGWKEEQIAEAVYVTAMFAFFNRVADAFGICFPRVSLDRKIDAVIQTCQFLPEVLQQIAPGSRANRNLLLNCRQFGGQSQFIVCR
jgi:hypothetical protein